MANMEVEGNTNPKMVKATGTGTNPDPFVVEHALPAITTAYLAAIAKRYAQNINLKIDFASVAEQTIIAAPAAGSRIVIQSIFLTCLVNNIVTFKSGTTEIGKAYVYAFSKDYISGLILGTAEAFKLLPTLANPVYGQVCYYVEVAP